jgi:hypothetical protein
MWKKIFNFQKKIEIKISKLIDYSIDMCWSCQNTWAVLCIQLDALSELIIPTLVTCKNFKGFFLTIFKHCWHIYLWSKVVCLFCFVLFCTNEIHQTRMLRITFLLLWKALEEGCISLVSWCLDLRCKSSWILNDFFTEN